jgi:putative oxidoreductase
MPPSNIPSSVCTDDQSVQLHLVASGGRAPEAQARVLRRPAQRVEAIELALHRWLVAHSLAILRISLGAVFLGFGFLKFFPGVSPAENLVVTTTSMLTFGLVPHSLAIVAIAVMECVIGMWLLIGRALRGVMYLLAVELIGILSPIVLLGGRLFSGPHNAPTLEGQYVLKDVIIVGAVLVLAATVRRARLMSTEALPVSAVSDPAREAAKDRGRREPVPHQAVMTVRGRAANRGDAFAQKALTRDSGHEHG